MTSTPTGRLLRASDGHELVITRTYRASVADVWASVTEPERTARWFGPWQGDAAPGRTIKVQMAYEEGAPWMDVLVEACEPPRRLALYATDEHGAWRLELRLAETADGVELQLAHRLEKTDGIGEFGPGWEYYLDQLTAARDGAALPDFDDYYPAMKPYYDGLAG